LFRAISRLKWDIQPGTKLAIAEDRQRNAASADELCALNQGHDPMDLIVAEENYEKDFRITHTGGFLAVRRYCFRRAGSPGKSGHEIQEKEQEET
jgi:hypothetical protein